MAFTQRPYRSRTSKPCDACRRRRTACIRGEWADACALCSHRGVQCTFLTEPTRRSKPSAPGAPASEPEVSTQSALFSIREDSSDQHRTSPASQSHTLPHVTDGATLSDITLSPGHSFLYSGSSSDQDPHLLRHLVYDRSSRFGNTRWAVWRMGTGTTLSAPTYFTIYPNDHLDVHTSMYSTERINALAPHQDELIRLYYTYVHRSYPVLDPQEIFVAKRAAGYLPASLLAIVYLHGSHFWHESPLSETNPRPALEKLDGYILTCLAHESHTPNIAVVQAILLFLHTRPRWVRAPNHPGTWALSCMLVGVAQDIGLNLEPSSWTLSAAERKLRRILWWAIFVHDKSIAHWLGRPSHITSQNWNVSPLTLDDFADAEGKLSVETVAWANAFRALCTLSMILSDVLDTFYTIRSNFDRIPVHEAITKAQPLLYRIDAWKQEYPLLEGADKPYIITLRIAALGLITSIHRAVFGALRSPRQLDSQLEMQLVDNIAIPVQMELIPLLAALETTSVTGLWLSYNKGNITLIGSCLIALVLASFSDENFRLRRELLMTFRNRLEVLVGMHEFVELPLRRLHLILEEIFGADVGSLNRLKEDCLAFPRWAGD
ncbi:fungal-specific transcription factor domain-containing protein [Aspergillus granulosus]|uniref:Fungal-specific transcription factor domain-containing protein n=1 Tax=Aspergillus granulosus TaxID=176169 RepID=A0ABR4HBG7_9EURO